MERNAGVEPTSPAWQAGILPLNEPRSNLVGTQGFAPRFPANQAGFLLLEEAPMAEEVGIAPTLPPCDGQAGFRDR